MFEKFWIGVKERIRYGREILNESAATSEKIAKSVAKTAVVIKWLIILSPLGIVLAIGDKAKWSVEDWIKKPSLGLLLWLCILMLNAAFNKHKKQAEIIASYESKKSELEIGDVEYHRPPSGSDECLIRVKNVSKTAKAENVQVKIAGKLIAGILHEGFNPFFDADLKPTSGVRTINPDTSEYFRFSDGFMEMLRGLEMALNRAGYRESEKQIFTITASSVDMFSATSAVFEIGRDKIHPERPAFFKQPTLGEQSQNHQKAQYNAL